MTYCKLCGFENHATEFLGACPKCSGRVWGNLPKPTPSADLPSEASAQAGALAKVDNVHPNIRFRIIGYRVIRYPERLSNGLAGHVMHNHDQFPDGSFEDIKRSHPIGSEHAHVPPAPCRFEMVFTGARDMLEERRQLFCRHCYPAAVAVDNRKGAIA